MSFSWMLPFIRFCRNDIAPCALALSIKTRRSYKLASSDLWSIVIALLEPLCSPLLTVYCNIDCALYLPQICSVWQMTTVLRLCVCRCGWKWPAWGWRRARRKPSSRSWTSWKAFKEPSSVPQVRGDVKYNIQILPWSISLRWKLMFRILCKYLKSSLRNVERLLRFLGALSMLNVMLTLS